MQLFLCSTPLMLPARVSAETPLIRAATKLQTGEEHISIAPKLMFQMGVAGHCTRVMPQQSSAFQTARGQMAVSSAELNVLATQTDSPERNQSFGQGARLSVHEHVLPPFTERPTRAHSGAVL